MTAIEASGVSGRRRTCLGLFLLIVACLAGGCASSPNNGDPLEPLNRAFFEFNMTVDKFVFKPVSDLYVAVVPEPIRTPIGNFFDNLRLIPVIINDLLQGRTEQAFSDVGRFIMNSTLGIGGLFDPATDFGLRSREQNFGVTAGVWGLPQGPYLVLPFLGPTTLSGLPEIPLQLFTNPLFNIDSNTAQNVLLGVGATNAITRYRDEIEMVREAVDPYIFMREGYLQRQRRLIEGDESPEMPFDDLPADVLEGLIEPNDSEATPP